MAQEETLEDLKAKNLAEEEAETTAPQVDEEAEDEAGVDEATDEHDESGETDNADADDKPIEDWMKGDKDDDDEDGAPSKAGTFTDADMAKARRKYRGKIQERDEELERLRAENADLKKPRPKSKALAEPKRENFEDSVEGDRLYNDAVIDYRFEKQEADSEARRETQARQTKVEEKQKKTEKAVDQHYERAVTLATESGITPEMYQGADFKVRSMVDNLFDPKRTGNGIGDAIVDSLIASLGEGSEKVMFNLGVNNSRLGELEKRFMDDPTGVKASIYLGQLNAELSAPRKKKTNAPKPAPDIQGDKTVKAEHKALKNEYDKADKKGDVQARFNARRKARQAGIDTKNW